VRVSGYIDGVIGDALHGWAWDEDAPDRRLVLRAQVDGEVLARGRAAEPRSDLVRHGIGDGYHGFRIPLTRPLGPGEHRIAVVDVDSGSRLPLSTNWIAWATEGVPLPGVALVEDPEVDLTAEPAASPVGLAGVADWVFPGVPAEVTELCGAHAVPHAVIDAYVEAVEGLYALGDELRFTPVVAVLPDKLHVYPEHLPGGLDVEPANRIAARLVARLRDSQVAEVLDLLPVMADARAHGRVFTRTGAQPTWTGAFYAARAIAKALAVRGVAVTPMPWNALDLGIYEPVPDSLAKAPLAGRRPGEPVRRDLEPVLAPGMGLTARPGRDIAPGLRVLERAAGLETPRLLVAGEPLTGRIGRLLAEHASTTLLLDTDRLDEDVIQSERPGVVVQILTDGGLLRRSGVR
jgi:hypothetical protein